MSEYEYGMADLSLAALLKGTRDEAVERVRALYFERIERLEKRIADLEAKLANVTEERDAALSALDYERGVTERFAEKLAFAVSSLKGVE